MKLPAISIVMPAFNAARTIGSTIKSVLAQSFTDFELIIIDDGSTDDTLHRALEFAESDRRIRLKSQPNKGASVARNYGIDQARAQLVAFIDADDLWHQEKLARHIAVHTEDETCAASYARIAFIGENANSLDGARTHSSLGPANLQLVDVLGENPVCTTSNFVIRTEKLRDIGGFNEAITHAEDQDLLARIISSGWKIEGIDAVLTGYRLSPGGLSMDLGKMHQGWQAVASAYLAPDQLIPLEALYFRYLARRTLRGDGPPRNSLNYVMAGLRLDASTFLSDRKRGFLTVIGAMLAPILPSTLRHRLFA